MKYFQSPEVDWSQEEEVSEGIGNPCFSLPWTRWTTIKVWKQFETTWQTKNRTRQKYMETSSKHSVLVQFKACSEERIAVLSNTITRNRSLQHTASDLRWESDEMRWGTVSRATRQVYSKGPQQTARLLNINSYSDIQTRYNTTRQEEVYSLFIIREQNQIMSRWKRQNRQTRTARAER